MQERFENSERFKKFSDNHLKRFFTSIYDEVRAWDLYIRGIEYDEIFRQISKGKGVLKSHVSGKYKEGELKRG